MSKLLNDNIKKAQKDIEEDRKIINDTIKVLGEFQKVIISKTIYRCFKSCCTIKICFK